MSATAEATAIRPFRIEVPEDQIADLRRRIAATRWPSSELVADRSQGVQLATIQALARYWSTDYDWRACEARLNALPQFTTEIDGVDIHFIHVRSPHEDALPLIMTHGWPGSVVELLETVGPLTDPTAHGGSAEDAFDLVLPSIPGYGFSGEPAELGWYAGRVAQAWPELMRRLGYTRYVAQGGDVGAAVTDAMGRQAPEGLIGIHTNLFVPGLAAALPADTEEEKAAAAARSPRSGRPASATSSSRQPGRRRSATPCWTHRSPWRPGCSTTTRTATTRSPAPSSTASPSGNLTRDHILDNITLYWLTGTGASAARCTGRADRPPPGRPGRLLRRSRSRSDSPRSPARSSRPRAAGSSRLPQPHLLQQGRQGRPLRRLGGARAVRGRGARGVQVAPLSLATTALAVFLSLRGMSNSQATPFEKPIRRCESSLPSSSSPTRPPCGAPARAPRR